MGQMLTLPLGLREPVQSYVTRVALLNGARDADEFCRDFGFRFANLSQRDARSLSILAEISGASLQKLEQFSPRKGLDCYIVAGEYLEKPNLRYEIRRICPLCIKQQIDTGVGPLHLRPYYRVEWLLEPIQCCAEHNVKLVEVENSAAFLGELSLNAMLGENISELPRLIRSSTAERPSDLESYFMGRLSAEYRHTPMLDGETWHTALKVSLLLGATQLFGPNFRVTSLLDHELHRARVIGYKMIKDGADAIDKLLTQLARSFTKRRTPWGMPSVYGHLYTWLNERKASPSLRWLRDIVREHALRTLPLDADNVIFGHRVERRRLHSLASAAAETGAHPKRLGKILANCGVISADQLHLSSDRVIFDAMSSADILNDIRDELSANRAMQYLQMPRDHFAAVRRANLIRPLAASSKPDLSFGYTRRELDTFLGSLLHRAGQIEKPKPNQRTIAAAIKGANCSAIEVVNGILEGKFRWVGCLSSATGYSSVLVDINEVKELVKGRDHGGLALRQAALALGVSTRVLNALLKQGHLKSNRVRNPVTRNQQNVVLKTDLDAFKSNYVRVGALAAELGEYVGVTAARLESKGFEPAFDPAAVYATFYRRADADFTS